MNTPGRTFLPGQGGAGYAAAMQWAPSVHTLPLGFISGASLFNLPGFSLAPQGLRIPALFSGET